MKRPVMFVAAVAALLSFGVIAGQPTGSNATEPNGPSYAAESPQPVAGLAWRCGKNNPAMWGTIGNGCLKQKRQAKKNASAEGGASGFSHQPATMPQQPAKARFAQ